MTRLIRSIPLLAIALLPLLPAAAAANTLRGTVVDAATDLPVAGVKVLVAGAPAGAVTGPGGRFELADIPDQPFTLVASHLAYETRLMMVSPMATADATLRVALTPTYYQGEKLVISASRYGSDLHLSRSNITSDRIRGAQAEKDVPQLLESTPGLYAFGDAGNGVGYTYLRLRGFDQRRVAVSVNGIPLNDPEDHQVYWVSIPDLASSLQDIQVQRGITNSIDGLSAIGGTINLATDVLASEPGGRVQLAAGSYGTNKEMLSCQTGLLGGRFAASARISHLGSEGYRDRSGSEQWSLFLSGRYITPASATQFNFYTGRELTQQAWFGIDEATLAIDRRNNPETYSNAVDDFRQPHYELHHRWNLGDRAVLKNTAYWIHGEGYYENFIDPAARADIVEWAAAFNLDALLGFAAGDRPQVVRRQLVDKDQVGWQSKLLISHAGGELAFGGGLYTFASHQYGRLMAVEGRTPAELSGLPNYYDYNGDKFVWSATVNERLHLGHGATLLLDMHYQRLGYDLVQNEVGNFAGANRHAYSVDHAFFNPKGGMHWQTGARPLGGELAVYGQVGLAHREPSALDYFDTWLGPWDLGAEPLFARRREIMVNGAVDHVEWSEPLVEAERAMNYELGMAWEARETSLQLNAYLMDFENEIVSAGAINPNNGLAVRGNADRTLHRGVEMELRTRLPGFGPAHGSHEMHATYSKSWDEFEEFTVYESVWDELGNLVDTIARDLSGNPIANFPDYLGSIAVESTFGTTTTSVSYHRAGRQHLDNSGNDSRSIDPFGRLDLAASFLLASLGLPELGAMRAGLRVTNLLDAEYETWGYYDPWGAGNYKVPAAGRHFLLELRHEF